MTPENVFPWRPVPRRRRCERCEQAAVVDLEGLYLCGDCFLEESKRRYATALSTNTRSLQGTMLRLLGGAPPPSAAPKLLR